MPKYREWISELLPHFSPAKRKDLALQLEKSGQKGTQAKSKSLEYAYFKSLEELARDEAAFSPRVEIHRHVVKAEWLYLKGIHNQALFQIEKAIKVALNFEFLEEMQTLLEWKWKLKMVMESEAEALQVLSQMEESQARLAEIRVWKFHFTRALQWIKSDDKKSENTLSAIQFLPEKEPVSIRARLMFFVCKSLKGRQEKQWEQARMAIQQALLIIEKQPAVSVSNPALVIQIFFQQLQFELENKALSSFLSSLDAFENLRFYSQANQERVRITSLFFRLKAWMIFPSQMPEAEISVKEKGPSILPDWNLALVVFLLVTQKANEALRFIQTAFLKNKNIALSPNEKNWLALAELLILFDLGHFDLISFKAKALKKRLKRYPIPQKAWIEILMNALQESARAERFLPEIFETIKKELGPALQESLFTDHYFLLEDLRFWLEFKLKTQ